MLIIKIIFKFILTIFFLLFGITGLYMTISDFDGMNLFLTIVFLGAGIFCTRSLINDLKQWALLYAKKQTSNAETVATAHNEVANAKDAAPPEPLTEPVITAPNKLVNIKNDTPPEHLTEPAATAQNKFANAKDAAPPEPLTEPVIIAQNKLANIKNDTPPEHLTEPAATTRNEFVNTKSNTTPEHLTKKVVSNINSDKEQENRVTQCENCGFEGTGRFCSNCGATLQVIPPVKPTENTTIPDWQICISFGRSTSSNFDRALYLAKAANKYIETEDDAGKPVYQAFFTKDQYLQFITLYELIGNWKSCFVFINNEMVDRKIVGNINYCYGDKLRSGNPDFCYGASKWTENPFGCHRAQMHYNNDAWYTFGELDTAGIFHVDIEKIVEELQIRLTPYKYCPALDMEDVLYKASMLPRTINPKKQDNWEYATFYYTDGSQGYGVRPKSHSMFNEINLSLRDYNQSTFGSKNPKKPSSGPLSRFFRP